MRELGDGVDHGPGHERQERQLAPPAGRRRRRGSRPRWPPACGPTWPASGTMCSAVVRRARVNCDDLVVGGPGSARCGRRRCGGRRERGRRRRSPARVRTAGWPPRPARRLRVMRPSRPVPTTSPGASPCSASSARTTGRQEPRAVRLAAPARTGASPAGRSTGAASGRRRRARQAARRRRRRRRARAAARRRVSVMMASGVPMGTVSPSATSTARSTRRGPTAPRCPPCRSTPRTAARRRRSASPSCLSQRRDRALGDGLTELRHRDLLHALNTTDADGAPGAWGQLFFLAATTVDGARSTPLARASSR